LDWTKPSQEECFTAIALANNSFKIPVKFGNWDYLQTMEIQNTIREFILGIYLKDSFVTSTSA
jgi:hypothetical protein